MSSTGLLTGGEGNETVRPTLPDAPVPNTSGNPGPLAYSGPRSGTINWSGQLEKDGVITIEGNGASSGSMTGGLPGVPVSIDFNSKEFALAEAPAPSNGWKRLVMRSRHTRHSAIAIQWTVIQ
jgi:hypothetical protein